MVSAVTRPALCAITSLSVTQSTAPASVPRASMVRYVKKFVLTVTMVMNAKPNAPVKMAPTAVSRTEVVIVLRAISAPAVLRVVPMVTMANTAARSVPAKAQSSVIPRMGALVLLMLLRLWKLRRSRPMAAWLPESR